LLFTVCLLSTGCYLNHEARLKIINREAEEATARAEERLDRELEACGDDVACRYAAIEKHAAAMREIQATRDARVDAFLEETR
jgi:hypothetical protein